MTDTTTATETGETGSGAGEQKQEQIFSQADLDRIVKDRLAQQAKKFADYDELKAAAAGAKTLEERVGTLEGELTATRTDALRSKVAARFGISTDSKDDKPSDADLFLTGSDEATLVAQAERLSARAADVKKHGNVAPNEGETKTSGKSEDAEARETVGQLFGGAESD